MNLSRWTVAVEVSDAMKLIGCAATYLSQASCWPGCAFFGAGCYAEAGPTGWITARLNKATGGKEASIDPRTLARDEARAIDGLSGRRALRVHVVGDARTNGAARILGAAIARYRARKGSPVWTYTHVWRTVARASWGKAVSVLASCESIADVRSAMRAGWAAALVVPEHPADGKAYVVDGLTYVPCPAQTRGVDCRECKLCWRERWLRRARRVITFSPHGPGKNKAAAALVQVAGMQMGGKA